MDVGWNHVTQWWLQEAARMPLLSLQAAGAVGLFSLLLLVGREGRPGARLREGGLAPELLPGLVFGMLGLLLTLLARDWRHAPATPHLRLDLLFLAGLVGGARSAATALAMIGGARAAVGDAQVPGFGLVDMGLVAAAGAWLHGRLRRRVPSHFRLRDLLVAWGVRVGAGLATPTLLLALQQLGAAEAAMQATQRLAGALLSLAMLGAVLALLQREAAEREARARYVAQSRIDALTGLPNRRALREYFDALLRRDAAATHTLLLIEIGNVIDMVLAHGHDWTDGFWRELEALMHHGRSGALLSAFDPRCFQFSDLTLAVVLHRVALDRIEADALVPRLHAELSDALRYRRPGPLPGLRFGVAEAGGRTRADAAATLRNLSLALRSDEQPVRYFRQSIAEKAALDAQLRQLLMQWIVSRAPPLCYQPKCELDGGRVVGAEALLRARSEAGVPLAPPHVVEIAGRHHLLAEFEWSTVDAVVRDVRRCLLAGLRLPLSVNLSAASVAVPGFARRLAGLLRSAEVPGALLTIEVTETSPLPDIDEVHDNMQQLQALGVRLSLDDFGTGYAALSLLAKFPFGEVKIDRSMVARLEQPRMQAAVSLALESARCYHATLVAEGVETAAQREHLRQLGLAYGQGYLFAAALPIDEVIAMAASQSGGQSTASSPLTA